MNREALLETHHNTSKSSSPHSTKQQYEPTAHKVTPSALLKNTIQDSTNLSDAFNQLNAISTNKNNYSPSQRLLAQKAQTLLVRAHPEIIPGLPAQLSYLPNRFMSYFKEKLPTLSTQARQQRFTQSIVMETLKSMPIEGRMTKATQENNLTMSPQEQTSSFNEQFDNQLQTITKKYTNDLSIVSNSEMFIQWSRNIITEVALLAPRTVGVTVGAGVGAAAGAIVGAGGTALLGTTRSLAFGSLTGGVVGDYIATGGKNNIGFAAKAYKQGNNSLGDRVSPWHRNVSYRTYGQAGKEAIGGIALGAAAGGLATGAGLATTAVATPAIGAATAVAGATNGGQYGAKLVDNAAQVTGRVINQGARSAYRQGAKLFTPRSNLTTENVANLTNNKTSTKDIVDTNNIDTHSVSSNNSSGFYSTKSSVGVNEPAPENIRI